MTFGKYTNHALLKVIHLARIELATFSVWGSRQKERQTLTNKAPLMPHRQRGGIEPLHVSMPLELKSNPSTSPTHPGFMLQHLPEIATLALLP